MAESLLPFEEKEAATEQSRISIEARPWTVSMLIARINEALHDAFVSNVAVIGQISNFKKHSSGHLYFSLKDDYASINAVMFRSDAANIRYELEDGLEVLAEGRVEVYPPHGRLQLYVQRITLRGIGELEIAFRQLKERLQKQGLFDPKHKKPIVQFPRAIGVITSPTGAAIRDIVRTLSRRWPAARVFLLPVRVQGELAAEEIAEAIRLMDTSAKSLEIDTIILARGGGSLEELWAFNEEIVARAIFAAKTPIITGIGHEVDFTIADFVADVRAATPTAAAEIAVPDRSEIRNRCKMLSGRLIRAISTKLSQCNSALTILTRSTALRDPTWRVRIAWQELDEITARMRRVLQLCKDNKERQFTSSARRLLWSLEHRAKKARERLNQVEARFTKIHPEHRLDLLKQKVQALARQLESMSYRAVIKRGFSVTRLADGRILRTIHDVSTGSPIETEVADGKIHSTVFNTKEGNEVIHQDNRGDEDGEEKADI